MRNNLIPKGKNLRLRIYQKGRQKEERKVKSLKPQKPIKKKL